ncbi:unnamed protein product, partial [Lampetra planeri]
MAVLHPFAKLPEPRTATVLLVGAVGPGQSALAEAMCRINSPFSINVHIASKLPLPGHNEHRRPRIDLILLLIDLTSINSLRVVEDSLRLLSASFFIGRVFFAITKDGERGARGRSPRGAAARRVRRPLPGAVGHPSLRPHLPGTRAAAAAAAAAAAGAGQRSAQRLLRHRQQLRLTRSSSRRPRPLTRRKCYHLFFSFY